MFLAPVVGDLIWSSVAESGMRSLAVEGQSVVFEDEARFEARVKAFAFEALIAQFAVHGLAFAVLPRRALVNVEGLHPLASQPAPPSQHRPASTAACAGRTPGRCRCVKRWARRVRQRGASTPVARHTK